MGRGTWSAVIGIGLVSALLAAAPAAQAENFQRITDYTPGDKLVRGLANVFLGWLEIPRNIHNTTQEESLLEGWTVGTGKGLGYTVLRFFVGAYEVITFPFPLPDEYVPVYKPEFVWQASGPKYYK